MLLFEDKRKIFQRSKHPEIILNKSHEKKVVRGTGGLHVNKKLILTHSFF